MMTGGGVVIFLLAAAVLPAVLSSLLSAAVLSAVLGAHLVSTFLLILHSGLVSAFAGLPIILKLIFLLVGRFRLLGIVC